MKTFKGLVLAGLLSIIMLISLPISAKAADNGIEISPLSFNLDIPAGGSNTGQIIVTNHNSTGLNYVIEVSDFASVDDNGAVSFIAPNQQPTGVTSLADWFTFDSQQGVVPPSSDKIVHFSINIPVGADPGGHYAAIFAREIKKSPSGQAEIGIASRVGTLVLVSVPGKVTKTAQITDFSYPKFVWGGPVQFTMKAQNTGTVHFDIDGKVSLQNIIGKAKLVDLGTHTIIPSDSRNYVGNWQNKYPFGIYKTTPYIALGQNVLDTAATVTIVAIPLMIVIPLILGLIILIWLLSFLHNHFRFVEAPPEAPDNK
jgi:hypothetical protein